MIVSLRQEFSQQQQEMVSRVDDVRDLAVSLMNTKHHALVEPDLTALNQRWHEVKDKLKVCDVVIDIRARRILLFCTVYYKHAP